MTDTMIASGDLIATQKAFKQLIGETLTYMGKSLKTRSYTLKHWMWLDYHLFSCGASLHHI